MELSRLHARLRKMLQAIDLELEVTLEAPHRKMQPSGRPMAATAPLVDPKRACAPQAVWNQRALLQACKCA